MAVTNDDPRSAYEQVADDLRRQIAAGSLKAGQRLDGNRTLAEHYGVAQMTVRHALDILRDEGLIVSQQGRGTFVAADAPGSEGFESDEAINELAEIKAALDVINRRLDHLEAAVRPKP